MASTTSSAMPPARPMVLASEPVTLLPTWLRASAAPAPLRMPVRIAVRPAADSQPASVDSHEKPPNSSFWRSRRDAADGGRSRRPPHLARGARPAGGGGGGRPPPPPATLDLADAGRPVGRRGGSRRRHGY